MEDNKGAYIAGMNSPIGSSPPSFSGTQQQQDQQQQSFQAAQDEKAYVEKAKGNPTNNPNVDNYEFQTESYQNAPSPTDVAIATLKDPYNLPAFALDSMPKSLNLDKKLDALMTGIGDLDFSLPFSPFGLIPNALKGAEATKRFFNSLRTKGVDGLSTEDKIILANLIKAGGLEGDINFEKYSDELITSDIMEERFKDAASKLAEGVTVDGETVSYEDLIDQYEDGKPGGVGDLFGLLDVREKGITLEKLKDTLGSEGLAYLQANNPALYFNTFGVPATLAGTEMDDLASMSLQGLTNSPEDKKLAQMIVEARERIAENRQGGQGNAGQGIVAAAPKQPFEILPQPRPGPIVPDPTQPNQIIPTPLKPVGVAGLGNYPSFFPFLYNNTYTNRGLPSAYSNILSKYYGFA